MSSFSVIGLGKLGASMAAAIASRGFNVVGVDIDESVVSLVNNGEAPILETGLGELIAENRSRLRATTDVADAVHASDLTFVVVPTPSDEVGAFSIRYTAAAFADLGRAIADKDEYHLVVLTSTVLPGSTRYGLLPILEEESGKQCGTDFGLCYSPEFIALGSVIRDFLNPDFLLIGESDPRAGEILESCYSEIVRNAAPCRRMTFENAELAKIALNAYVTTKITFANMLAALCERIPGGDVDTVADALGLDRRVGRAYLTGGLGFGGPCFPRDNLALAHFAELVRVMPVLPLATHAANESIADAVIDRVGPRPPGSSVAVLGLAYKPSSNVTERAQGMTIAKRLASRHLHVIGYDPLATDAARAELDGRVHVVDSLEECLCAQVIILATPDPQFRGLSLAVLEDHGVEIVVDCWRLLGGETRDGNLRYIPLGRNVDGEEYAAMLAQRWTPADAFD